MAHTSRCLEHVGTLTTLALPGRERCDRRGRATEDFTAAGPYSVAVETRCSERAGFVLVGCVPVIVRVFYEGGGIDTTEPEDVRLTLDLERIGPLRVLVPADARVFVYAVTAGFDVWADDLRTLDCAKDST